MDILALDIAPQTLAILSLLVIATIKLIDQLFDRDFRGASKIIGAGLIGVAVAYGVDGLSVLAGLAVGLAGSGLITAVGYTKKTTPVETLG